MEKIIIENFGPVRKAQIEIKDINIYIGTTSSGKSTVAKLLSIFKSGQLVNGNLSIDAFKRMLTNYNIEFDIDNDTYIKYDMDGVYYEVQDGKRL